jgi:hypothetical protein
VRRRRQPNLLPSKTLQAISRCQGAGATLSGGVKESRRWLKHHERMLLGLFGGASGTGRWMKSQRGRNSKRGAIPEVGNTTEGHRISARNKTSRSSTRGVAAGETRSALREVTARRERPATSREALCGGGKPLNETTRARFISTPSPGDERWSSRRGLKPQDRERQVDERRPVGHGKKELCSGTNHKGMNPVFLHGWIGGRSGGRAEHGAWKHARSPALRIGECHTFGWSKSRSVRSPEIQDPRD